MLRFFLELIVVLLIIAAIILCIWDAIPGILKVIVVILAIISVAKKMGSK